MPKLNKMKHKIEIQKLTEVENELFENIKKWIPYKKLWAEKKQLKSSNSYVLGKETIEYVYRFKIRYRTDITEDMRILYKDKIYDIININNIDEIDLYETHIDCVERKEGVYNE